MTFILSVLTNTFLHMYTYIYEQTDIYMYVCMYMYIESLTLGRRGCVARNHKPRTCIKLSATRSLICISTLASLVHYYQRNSLVEFHRRIARGAQPTNPLNPPIPTIPLSLVSPPPPPSPSVHHCHPLAALCILSHFRFTQNSLFSLCLRLAT